MSTPTAEITNPRAIAICYVEAFGSRDLETISTLLADDVEFASPRATVSGKEAVLAAISEFSQVVTGVEVVAAFGNKRQALIRYDLQTRGATLHAVDHVVVEDGLIVSDRLIVDLQRAG